MTSQDYGLTRQMWHQRLAGLTGPLLGAFESGLLPSQSSPGIATVPPSVPRP
jgi:hypothetical protein